jgi:hypothetical protein
MDLVLTWIEMQIGTPVFPQATSTSTSTVRCRSCPSLLPISKPRWRHEADKKVPLLQDCKTVRLKAGCARPSPCPVHHAHRRQIVYAWGGSCSWREGLVALAFVSHTVLPVTTVGTLYCHPPRMPPASPSPNHALQGLSDLGVWSGGSTCVVRTLSAYLV